MFKELTYKAFGDKAILIEWPVKIDPEILEDIIQLKSKIESELSSEIEEVVIAYNSITIIFKCSINHLDETIEVFKNLHLSESKINHHIKSLWKIPVCYDTTFGLDLEVLSETLQLSKEEIITLHTQPQYTVYFIGFLPGFLYLGGLDERLTMPRKATPRLQVEQGSVAIGGSQTGIYPMESAGGWNLIGKTPVPFFDSSKDNPCFAKSGDTIQFVPISMKEYKKICLEVEAGVYELENTLLHD
ncbi:5-oxoprolinase subunit PxpB [Pustulibacterium marinum]|uniref:5-oxoprolinase subunit PxpB n=1 Tax=Pustulibacterium marinum TaxID=1224947 RepID=UPI000B847778|nr:5-oxoprolinase subunit PxpB [Pustulibacterium marinum]